MIGTASAPGSSGNLGPGFDSLALAISLRCSATVEPSENMVITQDGVTLAVAPEDMVHKVVLAATGRPMHITIANEVPRARGLGSSAAVLTAVAGAAIASMGRDIDRYEVFQLVRDLEQHPDNAAASVYGGLVISDANHIKTLSVHDSFGLVFGIPNAELATKQARKSLPDAVPLPVVARTIARVSFLVAALVDGDVDALKQCGSDEIHELPRASLSPVTGEMIDAALAAGAVHACWSGAGPTVLAFTTSASRGRVIGALAGALGPAVEVLVLHPDYEGLIVGGE